MCAKYIIILLLLWNIKYISNQNFRIECVEIRIQLGLRIFIYKIIRHKTIQFPSRC